MKKLRTKMRQKYVRDVLAGVLDLAGRSVSLRAGFPLYRLQLKLELLIFFSASRLMGFEREFAKFYRSAVGSLNRR